MANIAKKPNEAKSKQFGHLQIAVTVITVPIMAIILFSWIEDWFLIPSDNELIEKTQIIQETAPEFISLRLPESSMSLSLSQEGWKLNNIESKEFVLPHSNELGRQKLMELGLDFIIWWGHLPCTFYRQNSTGIWPTYDKQLYHCIADTSPDCGFPTSEPTETFYTGFFPFTYPKNKLNGPIQRDLGNGWFICFGLWDEV